MRTKKINTIQDLRDQADFSNFNGGNLDGTKDFTVTITNLIASDKTVRIFPGLGYSSTGTIADGVLRTDTATGFASLEGTANSFNATGESAGKIEELLDFLNQNPSQLVMVRLQATDAAQVGKNFTIKKQNPFLAESGARTINVAKHKGSNNFQDKIVEIPFNETIDGQTILDLKVAADSSVDLTFFFGEIKNTAAEFAGA
jgi:hypothetical protein